MQLHPGRSAAQPPLFVRAAGAPFVLCAALLALAPRAGAQCASQYISLRPGWNAVYVEVSPEEDAGAVFANWPVDSVGVYDPAAFLATRQFSADRETEGLAPSPILMWNREYREATADAVCIWSFEGLRREGPVYAIGTASVRRVSPLSELILE